MRSKEQILADITKQLNWDSRINAKNILVEIIDHTAILSGIVGSYMQKKAAENDSLSIKGVSAVKNHLQIQRSEGLKGPHDREIVTNINIVITLNAPLKSSKIEVSSVGGVVTLNGSVDEYWKKIHAEELVFDVPGVYDVINRLSVVPNKTPVDQSIASSIISSLCNVEGISPDKITVEVSGGNVVLKGSVPSWYAYTAAYKIVLYTKGVTGSMLNLIIV